MAYRNTSAKSEHAPYLSTVCSNCIAIPKDPSSLQAIVHPYLRRVAPEGKTFRVGKTLLFLGLFALLSSMAQSEDPWGDTVVSYHAIDPNPGLESPEKTLGEPVGSGPNTPNNSSLHSVGRPGAAPGSYVTLGFETPVTDDPDNPMGLDCIVFSNCFWAGANPLRKWQEPGLIEISADSNGNGLADDPWYYIPGSRDLSPDILPEGIPNPTPILAGNVENPNGDETEYDWGYCELTPTQTKYLDNFLRPDDPFEVGLSEGSGGGDAFDIAWALPSDASGDPNGLSQFNFIRISAILDLEDPVLGFITPEIDAVADVAPDIDSDGDGILDEYESRVAGTDPLRKESTVLALEIPQEEGGSASGVVLGEAADEQGNRITLLSDGLRSSFRNYNCMVDILSLSDPAPTLVIAGLLKSGAVREFYASENDFLAAQIQEAELRIVYSSGEIAGLEESALSPYRFDGLSFSQEGISAIQKDTATNTVSFRSQYPGVFILASTSGAGDTDAAAPEIMLSASPPQSVVGNPGGLVEIESALIFDADDLLVPDNTPFTILSSLGVVVSPDAQPSVEGLQVLAQAGRIAFTLQSETVAGLARVSAIAQDGLLHGSLEIPILSGEAVGPIAIHLLDPNATAPGPVTFSTDVIYDAYGNPLSSEAQVTLLLEGGSCLSADADPEAPGHQLSLSNGVASFSVRVDTGNYDRERLRLSLFATPAQNVLLGETELELEVVQLPLRGAYTLFVLLLTLALIACRRQRKRVS